MPEKVERVVEKLVSLGLREYEARVYSALVGLGKATAREIHEASGVPRSRVYDILQKLAEKGFVDVEDGDTKRYTAVQPERAIGRIKEEIIQTANECISELEALRFKKQTFSPALVVRGERNITDRIRNIISESREEVVIVTTNGELAEVVLKGLRKPDIRVVCYVVGSARKLKIGKEAELWEVTNLSPLLRKMYLEGVEEGNVRVRIEAIFVFDSRKSFIVINESGQRTGLLMSLPIIAYIQTSMIKTHLSEIAKKVN